MSESETTGAAEDTTPTRRQIPKPAPTNRRWLKTETVRAWHPKAVDPEPDRQQGDEE
jgi:hypothetical protein